MLTAIAAFVAIIAPGCHTIDDDRIPVMPVNIVFYTVADWNIYGVSGALDYKYFIRDLRQPSNFPYTAQTFTGFGGILLLTDVMGNAQAYDLSCPVEANKNIRVEIDDEMLAHCPKCGSTYNVFSLQGHPVGGRAAELGYGMRRYHVGQGSDGVSYMVVSY